MFDMRNAYYSQYIFFKTCKWKWLIFYTRTTQGYNTVISEMHCLEFSLLSYMDRNSMWTARCEIFLGEWFATVLADQFHSSTFWQHLQERNVSDATPEGWASCASALPVWNRMNNQHVMGGLLKNKAKSLVAHSHVPMTMRPMRSSTRICQAEPTLDQPRLDVGHFQFSGISIFVVTYNTSSAAALRPSERPVTVSHSRPHGARLYRREDFHRRLRPCTSSGASSHIRGHLMTSLGSQKRTRRGTRRSLSFLWHVESVENNYVMTLNFVLFHLIFKKKKNVRSNDIVLVLFFFVCFFFSRKCFRCHAGKLTKCIESGFVYLLCWRMALVWYFDGNRTGSMGI